ncbi:MAG: hydrogenase nickel incorporation protein HypB [Anaerolineae bacterium]|nr:hydrogenase nickel incorporation protein HypB [Anaerolineae bacterium]
MSRTISVIENILDANDQIAASNRARLDAAGVYALNFMASPGAGKTSLIEKTVAALKSKFRIAVVEGDLATSLDAERVEAAGVQAVQINTGGGCHLDAVMLQQALDHLDLEAIDLLIVENVGNLVCPSNFKLGTHKSVLVASVPEGDDKPYKYPSMYRGVDAMVLNKTDLLPYINFRLDYFQRGVEALNPGCVLFPISCYTEEGLPEWFDWVSSQMASVLA